MNLQLSLSFDSACEYINARFADCHLKDVLSSKSASADIRFWLYRGKIAYIKGSLNLPLAKVKELTEDKIRSLYISVAKDFQGEQNRTLQFMQNHEQFCQKLISTDLFTQGEVEYYTALPEARL